ncbi:T9SS-dependent choice-of-anchor J family protein [Lentimicrobium sp. S6]|uniref:T9SS-dependent choice-of-anchor J family protein n=1 Tax=Lentimicrobium sp. S6 TaxID=2735872 RepID=UPI001553021B|nr:T9SS type A sorting domain-containing protein [Lentimicrobium sp. S6]NPD44643.1 T9SS type A sorting domain-containing protein [Lentimicrobium sp. S6]
MRKFTLLILIGFIIQLGVFAQSNQKSVQEVVFEEDFNGWTDIEAEGWFTFSGTDWNYIYPEADAITYFKQDPSDYMLLITPEIDLTTASSLTFSHKMISSVEGMKIEVGTMTDPTDPATFTLLNIVDINSGEWTTEGTLTALGGVEGNMHIAFNAPASCPAYTMLGIDDVVIVADDVQSDWPAYITNLEITPGEMGANHAIVSWTNPSEQADGDPLTELDSISVFMNDMWAYTIIDPVIGEVASAQIDIPEPGLYVYSLTAHNSEGSSVSIYNDPPIWVGLDTPGEAENVVLTVTNNNTTTLTWSAPSVGAHGAYFDGEVGAYKIIRVDGWEHTVEGTEFTFTEEVEIPGTYVYFVRGINTSGEGIAAVSNAAAYYFDGYLLAEDFWVSVPALEWVLDGEGLDDWYHWPTDYTGGDFWESIFYPNTSNPFTGVARAVSPVINSEDQASLTLKFKHFHNWTSGSYDFKVQTSINGTDWEDAWVKEITGSQSGETELIVIDNDHVGSSSFQFSFVFEGNSSSLEFFAFDEVRLYPSNEINLVASELQLPAIIQPNDIVSPLAYMENWGYLSTDFTAVLTFYQGSDAAYVSEINSNIEGGANQELNFEDWTAQEGAYLAELIITAEGDENPDDNTITQSFDVVYLNAERTLVVCEEATGTWCGYCPGAAMGLDELVENAWPVAVIAYHSGDEYETTQGRERLDYYEVSGYPTVVFDGVEQFVGGSASQSMYDNYLPIVQDRLSIPAAVSVEIEDIIFSGDVLIANISMESGSPLEGDQIALIAVLAESHIPESWQGFDELDFVERSIYNGAMGVQLDLSDQVEEKQININLDPSWVVDNSELVVFVQNLESREIYNGNKIDLMAVSINEVSKWVAIYPNPASDFISISNCGDADINIYNLQGQQVLSQRINGDFDRINVSGLDFGMYTIEFILEGEKFTKKIMINN